MRTRASTATAGTPWPGVGDADHPDGDSTAVVAADKPTVAGATATPAGVVDGCGST